MEDVKITKDEWIHIWKQMIHYNRQHGYVAKMGDKIALFDSEPSMGGVFVSYDDVVKYVKEYD